MLGDERREFGAYLRRVRKRKNLTLRELAEKSRVAFPNISAIECGRLGAGSIVATKLAAGLSLAPDPVGTSDKLKSNPQLNEYLQKVRDNEIVVVVVLKSGRQIAISREWLIF